MGGYAGFVWSAMAITVIVLAGLLLSTMRQLRAGEAALRELEGGRRPRRTR